MEHTKSRERSQSGNRAGGTEVGTWEGMLTRDHSPCSLGGSKAPMGPFSPALTPFAHPLEPPFALGPAVALAAHKIRQRTRGPLVAGIPGLPQVPHPPSRGKGQLLRRLACNSPLEGH